MALIERRNYHQRLAAGLGSAFAVGVGREGLRWARDVLRDPSTSYWLREQARRIVKRSTERLRSHYSNLPGAGQPARANWNLVPGGQNAPNTQPYQPGSRIRGRDFRDELGEEVPGRATTRRRIDFGSRPRSMVSGVHSGYNRSRFVRNRYDVYDKYGGKLITEKSGQLTSDDIIRFCVQGLSGREVVRQIGLSVLRYLVKPLGIEYRSVGDSVLQNWTTTANNAGQIHLYYQVVDATTGAVTVNFQFMPIIWGNAQNSAANSTTVAQFMDWFSDIFAPMYYTQNDIRISHGIIRNLQISSLPTTGGYIISYRGLNGFKVNMSILNTIVLQNTTPSDAAGDNIDVTDVNNIQGRVCYFKSNKPMYKNIFTNWAGGIPGLHSNFGTAQDDWIVTPSGAWSGAERDFLDPGSLRACYGAQHISLNPAESKTVTLRYNYRGFLDRFLRNVIRNGSPIAGNNTLRPDVINDCGFKCVMIEFKSRTPYDPVANANPVRLQYNCRQSICVFGSRRGGSVMPRQYRLDGDALTGLVAGGGAEVKEEPVLDPPVAPQLLAVAVPESDGGAARAARAAQHAGTDNDLAQLPPARPIKRVRRVRNLAEHATEVPPA